MVDFRKTPLNNEKGITLVMAIIACLILLAVGMLVMNMSTGDLIGSSMTIGNKKAFAAVETGISEFIGAFNTDTTTWTTSGNFYSSCSQNATIADAQNATWLAASNVDSNTKFAVCIPTSSSMAPLPVAGSAIGGGGTGQGWGYVRYGTTVFGKNASYGSILQINLGIGYGPVPLN